MVSIPEHIFKAYDVRGVYPGEVNEQVVTKIAGALGKRWQRASASRRSKSQGVRIVVGHDARLSSPSLYRAVCKSLVASGPDARMSKRIRKSGSRPERRDYTLVAAGLITTPMLYFLVNDLKAAGGIMVTASHNPKEYNGIKAVGPKAVPISGAEICRLITRLTSD